MTKKCTILGLLTLIVLSSAHPSHAFYDYKTGRWLNQDPIGSQDGPNLYAYVHSNPINRMDSFGLCADPPCGYQRVVDPLEGSCQAICQERHPLDNSAFNGCMDECLGSGEPGPDGEYGDIRIDDVNTMCKWDVRADFRFWSIFLFSLDQSYEMDASAYDPDNDRIKYHVHVEGQTDDPSGGGFATGYVHINAHGEDVEAPCKWPINENGSGAQAIITGASIGNAVKLSGGIYHVRYEIGHFKWSSTGCEDVGGFSEVFAFFIINISGNRDTVVREVLYVIERDGVTR